MVFWVPVLGEEDMLEEIFVLLEYIDGFEDLLTLRDS